MDILEKIIAHKIAQVDFRKTQVSIPELENLPLFSRQTSSLKSSLGDPTKTGIIAEFKRKSPSKGVINASAKPEEVASAYFKNGASGISVLTDENFFGGSLEDLQRVSGIGIPVLRKDFMIDEYQFYEAKAYGADIILLIAACLTPRQVREFATLAKQLGLEVLLEIHDESELGHISTEVDMVGVNNRNLKTFGVDINTSLSLIGKIPAEKPAVAESGISNTNTIVTLKRAGFSGFLMGEHFMKYPNPSIAFADFVNQLKAVT